MLLEILALAPSRPSNSPRATEARDKRMVIQVPSIRAGPNPCKSSMRVRVSWSAQPGPAGPGQSSVNAEGEVFGVDLLVGTVFDDFLQRLVQTLAQRVALAHGNTDLVIIEYRVTLELEIGTRVALQ